MSIEDYFDPYTYPDDEENPTEKYCKYCGKGNLHWEDDNGKWILIDSSSGAIHKCKSKPIKPFDVDMKP